MFRSVTDYGVTGQAVKVFCQLRHGILGFAHEASHVDDGLTVVAWYVDDGSAFARCYHAARRASPGKTKVIYLSPQVANLTKEWKSWQKMITSDLWRYERG